MDLSNYNLKANAEKGFDVEIKNPVDESDTDIIISVVGSDSSIHRNATIAAMVDFPLPDEGTTREKAEAVTRRSAAVMAACVVGWSGIEIEGETVDFTPEKALEIFSQYDWISDQVSQAVKNRENFTVL